MENIEEKVKETLPPGVEMDDLLSKVDELWKETEKRIIESIRSKLGFDTPFCGNDQGSGYY